MEVIACIKQIGPNYGLIQTKEAQMKLSFTSREWSPVLEGWHGSELDHESYRVKKEVHGWFSSNPDEKRVVNLVVDIVDDGEGCSDSQHSD